MQVLLIQDNLEVREKMSFFIESTYGAVVQEVPSISQAQDILKDKSKPFDLLILDIKGTALASVGPLRAERPNIPTIIALDALDASSDEKIVLADRAALTESVIEAIDHFVEKGFLQQTKSEQGQVRIRTKLLLSVCPLKGDIYIRLSKNKFVKLFREGDVFDLQDLEKYTIKKGVEYLYIREDQCKEFSQKYLTELQKQLASDQLSLSDVGSLNQSVHETVQELTGKMGFTDEIQQLTKTQVQLTVKSMGKDPDLAEILAKIQGSPGKYISSHSTLCAYLACAIASQLQWGSETTFHKLTLAAFLHDITLENHALAAIQTLEELEQQRAKFTEKELKDYKEHPMVAGEMAKKMTEVPADVDTIIRQHHEKPDSSGFPRHLSHAYIAPLSAVFIVAHDLTRYTLKAGDQFKLEEFLGGVRELYKSSQFKKVLGSLENLSKVKNFSAAVQEQKKAK